jgi:hypothetical protein
MRATPARTQFQRAGVQRAAAVQQIRQGALTVAGHAGHRHHLTRVQVQVHRFQFGSGTVAAQAGA